MRNGAGQKQRFHQSESPWLRSFAMDDMKILVVCRGPVRKEAFDVFDEMGVREYGMLLSEKDSVVYPRCLAPELRGFRFPANVHRVEDYMGVGREARGARIAEIVQIAQQGAYSHIFAGYGFMAEDAEFVQALEDAGLGFIGPSARVIARAGAKDEAKKLARSLDAAVIPGVDDISARALLKRGGAAGLAALARKHGLGDAWQRAGTPAGQAEALLQAGYAARIELVEIAELQSAAEEVCAELWRGHPGRRIRFKHVGGGGGKGQRVVSAAPEVAAAVMDVLAESKALEPGSNRNFLVEMNLESTRHNEIQLIGNGDWCISLGGRDCSLQMHEQKLLEVSLTREMLDSEIARAQGAARETLQRSARALRNMEEDGARFGAATGLDSVSTFECICSGGDHFFMEMNTRIQVEHAVSEIAYGLRFTNPGDAGECFFVDRLIEAMALLARHGARLPQPERVVRAGSGLEARINATNDALQPHAGGVIRGWSPPLPEETRFDQGIGLRNPDTGTFIWYNLAGAYDSNIALLLCEGETRRENYERMAEILRRTELRGEDLHTNLEMHYGLVQWFLGQGVMAEPDTRFMQSYLAAVGALQEIAVSVDPEVAWADFARSAAESARETLAAKQTLLLRPLRQLLAKPHLLGGFLGRYHGELWRESGGRIAFAANPLHMLERLYHFLGLEAHPDKPPSEQIWNHDAAILREGLSFYAEVESRTGAADAAALDSLFGGAEGAAALCGGDAELWQRCQAAHRGYQLGLSLLLIAPRLGHRAGFFEVAVGADLSPVFPARFLDPAQMAAGARALAPPPVSADEIAAPSGGTFYAREAPHLPPLIDEGEHFEEGQPLFVIEVMKMFNKVHAPFAGTLKKNHMAGRDGEVVRKGQAIFAVEPDERFEPESPEAEAARIRSTTLSLLRGERAARNSGGA